MKVVLRDTIEAIGERGTVVDVADGFARNYLMPRRLALPATPGNLRAMETEHRRWAVRAAKERAEAEALARRITSTPLELAHRAGDTDTLYGAVTASEIAYALEEKGIEIDRRRIQLEEPIKTLGSYQIPVRLHADVTAHVMVHVVRDEV